MLQLHCQTFPNFSTAIGCSLYAGVALRNCEISPFTITMYFNALARSFSRRIFT